MVKLNNSAHKTVGRLLGWASLSQIKNNNNFVKLLVLLSCYLVAMETIIV